MWNKYNDYIYYVHIYHINLFSQQIQIIPP